MSGVFEKGETSRADTRPLFYVVLLRPDVSFELDCRVFLKKNFFSVDQLQEEINIFI